MTSLLVWALQASTNTTILNTLQPLCLHFLRASCILRHYLCSRSLPCSSHKMKCKLPDCCGYNRLDNSCSSRACSLYRPSKRTLLNTWVYKLKRSAASSQTPPKMLLRSARRYCRRLGFKQPLPDSTPPGLTSTTAVTINHVVLGTTAADQDDGGSSSVATECLKGSIQDAVMDMALVPETDRPRAWFTPFLAIKLDHQPSLQEGCLSHLAYLTALEYADICNEVGEPRALQVYSRISSLLQKQPPDRVYMPTNDYVVALLYVAWELAGSWECGVPKVARSVPVSVLMEPIAVLLGFIGS